MKRKVDWDEEEESDYEDTNASEDEEGQNEEPRIKDVKEVCPNSFPDRRPPSYYTAWRLPKISCFWTPRRQLLRNQRIIPMTNISELVEYVLLPHNDDFVKPNAFKTFIDGLAELGIN